MTGNAQESDRFLFLRLDQRFHAPFIGKNIIDILIPTWFDIVDLPEVNHIGLHVLQ